MYDIDLSDRLFSSNRCYYWMLIPTIEAVYFLFYQNSYTFSSIEATWTLNPHAGYFPDPGGERYGYTALLVHNWFVSIALVVVYIVFGFFYYRKNHSNRVLFSSSTTADASFTR